MYLYLLPDGIQKNDPKCVVENNNKGTYCVRLLCSCGSDCWWLSSTKEWCCPNSFQRNVRDIHLKPHCNLMYAECGDLFKKTEQNCQIPLMRAKVLPGIRNGSSQTQVQSYTALSTWPIVTQMSKLWKCFDNSVQERIVNFAYQPKCATQRIGPLYFSAA